jgi:phosphinothricin acetyltransferase
MEYKFRIIEDVDGQAIMNILNYYAQESFAAYPEKPLPVVFFGKLKEMSAGYPFYVIVTDDDTIVGFGLLRPYHFAEVFKGTAELSYFILPEHTGKDLGSKLLFILINEAKNMGIRTLLANISSKNTASLNFHTKNGFQECGRFKNVGIKFGQEFDVVWMQKNV